MIDNDFTLLKPFADELDSITEEVADMWISRDRVSKVLTTHQLSPKFFRNHFGVKIYAYFIKVIRGNAESGNCPVVHVFLHFCEGKNIKLHDVYAICSELKNIVLFHFTKKMYERVDDEVFWKLSDLLDANFAGVIEEYMQGNCEVIYGCKNDDEDKEVALEVPQKKVETSVEKDEEVNHKLRDIRFSKEERYDSDSLFEMLDEMVIDKIESFMDDLNEMLLALYDVDDAEPDKAVELMKPIIQGLKGFYKLVDSFVVFPVMVNTFQNLSVFLSELTIDEYIKDGKKELLMQHLIGLVNDLEKWMDIVFIEKIADDVHYLDASFANNVVEIEGLFAEQEVSDEDEDDLEFF